VAEEKGSLVIRRGKYSRIVVILLCRGNEYEPKIICMWKSKRVNLFISTNHATICIFYFNNIYIIITATCFDTFVSSSDNPKFFTSLKLRSFQIFMKIIRLKCLLVIRCNLYDFCNVICISNMFT
jgi:hypothetical protein